ncbi:glycosyltransferase [Candidatus Pacearchaeota archaeon]|nr:glycosyltransferase [Candidatus Pacearchaeota archaeon]
MKKLKVSYILGIYNAERTLRECLDSIFMQNFPKREYEVIIVDGGSNDSTLNIVRQYQKQYKNMKLIHNTYKLSEGKGMGKDQGVQAAKGDLLIFLDHDNILLEKTWTEHILKPFADKKIMASQSLLRPIEEDPAFLQYVNAVGVEDAFAIPYSLVAQVTLHPEKFERKGEHYEHVLDEEQVLFGGANGCAFRREVFEKIGGYTRDVDIFAAMAEHKMKVAVPIHCRVYHKTSATLISYLRKKAIYFYRFIDHEYQAKKFKWVPKSFRGKVWFMLRVMYNLSLVGPLLVACKKFFETGKTYWLLHPVLLFLMTSMYASITLLRIRNFFRYL